MTTDEPQGETVPSVGTGSGKGTTITDLILGVVNWWCLKFGNSEVINLVLRHYDHDELYKSCLLLADTCGLSRPIHHKNTAARPALAPCADDLVKMMRGLIDSKELPSIVIPASDLGKVPLEAVSVTDERSVCARLESLEVCVQTVVSAVEKLSALKSNPAPSLPHTPAVSITPAAVHAVPVVQPPSTSYQTFAQVASKQVPAQPAGRLPVGHPDYVPLALRHRSRSPQVKRDHAGKEVDADTDGFRRQGRPRHLNRPAAAGASKVIVEEVGELQPSLQYYIGNTPGKANNDVIKKVLERCAEPLLQEKEPLVIESIHCLTKDPDPRTRCWRVVVPHRFKEVMENSLLYPEGWKYREFVGIFRNSANYSKKIRVTENTVVDQVMSEVEQQPTQGRDQQLLVLQQQVAQLLQNQSNGAVGQLVAGPTAVGPGGASETPQ